MSRTFSTFTIAVLALGAACAIVAAPASAGNRVQWMQGYSSPGTPKKYNQVGVLKFGRNDARNILVFVPGTSAGSAYIGPFARTLLSHVNGWQVWSVERRENLLEDQSVAERAKQGKVTPKRLFDYYLGWLADSSIKNHFQLIPDSEVEFAKQWGMRTEVNDLRNVVTRAELKGGHVVVMGHSLGGSITTAYATWDFNGRPGVRGLSGLVYDDGGSGPTPITRDEAKQRLADLDAGSPWLNFGGIAAPFAGLFAEGGALTALVAPNQPSLGQQFPLLPDNLKPPVPATNLAQWGYAADTQTSPSNLFAFQAHVGHLAASGDPRGWDQADDITPIRRYAKMFAGWKLKNVDGVAWYHPMRLTIDSGAVADGNPNPAQSVMGVKAIHGHAINVPIYAFGAFGGENVLDDARALAEQSHLPSSELTLVNRHHTYAHNDPAGAYPENAFLNHLVPFLNRITRR
ncbi:MAG TPA: alpha/beta hydrolase [Solirubrobacterales bacterium]